MSVPFSHEVIKTAKAWGLTPWALTGEPDTEATRSRYFFLQQIFSGMGL